MTYYLSRAMPVIAVLLALCGLASTVTGIFIDGGKNEPWGELAFLMYVVAAALFVVYGLWSEDDGLPKKPIRLSRDAKKELQRRQEQTILDASIRDLEAKLRDDA